MRSRMDKALAFRALHERPGAFIIPNPWDAGTAQLFAATGFEALATTSLGLANMLGSADSSVTREQVIANCRTIAAATDLPVNADLENCFAHEPEAAARGHSARRRSGHVGGSIEDFTGDPGDPIYDFDLSVARVRAAAPRSRSLPVPFLLTARGREPHPWPRTTWPTPSAACRLTRRPAPTCSTRRDCATIAEVRHVVDAVKRPFNVVTGRLDPDITAAQLAEAGAKRISVGGALSRLLLATLVERRAIDAIGTVRSPGCGR